MLMARMCEAFFLSLISSFGPCCLLCSFSRIFLILGPGSFISPLEAILLEYPGFRIFLLQLVFMQLVVANRPLRVTYCSYLLLGLFAIDPHENLIGPPRKIDQPPVDVHTLYFSQKRKSPQTQLSS